MRLLILSPGAPTELVQRTQLYCDAVVSNLEELPNNPLEVVQSLGADFRQQAEYGLTMMILTRFQQGVSPESAAVEIGRCIMDAYYEQLLKEMPDDGKEH
jgi:hypothetical protein